MRLLGSAVFLACAALVGCGATGNDGFDDADSGAYSWPSGTTNDAGSRGVSDSGFGSAIDSGASTSHDSGTGSTSPSDAGTSSTPDASTAKTAPYCQVAPAGGFVGGPPESLTFTGTATEASPLAGSPQTFTLTITGAGVNEAWNYDRCNVYVDMTTNLWGSIGSMSTEESTFSVGVPGGVLHVIALDDTQGSLLLRAQPRSTHFVGTYATTTTSYNVVVDAPADAQPCAAAPNCSFEGTTGDYCGESIDGYADTIYHCVGSNPATVVQTCTHSCSAASFGGVQCD